LARFLALDWDHQQVHLIAAKAGKGGVRIERALTWQEQQSPNPGEAEAQGALLRDRLAAEKIAPAPILLCVGRDRVIVKEVRYPAVPAAEEPAVVRFQALKELTDPAEDVVIDYIPAREEANGQRRALVLVLRRELLTAYKTICRVAGLKLQGVTPRPFGIAAGLRQAMGRSAPPPEPPDAAVAVLTLAEQWAEFCVVRGDQLVFARSMAPGAGLNGELRRNLALYAGQSHQHPVRALYVAGGSDLPRLQETLAIPVHAFDPLPGVALEDVPAPSRGGFAGPAGLLAAQGLAGGLPINFAQPKQPRPEKDPNRTRLLVAAAAGVLVLLAAIVGAAVHLQMKAGQASDLSDELEDLNVRKAALADDERRLKALDDWTHSEIVWLDELYDLTAMFPDPTNIRVKNFSGEPQDQSKTYAARMAITVVTTSDEKLYNQFAAELQKERSYTRHPPKRGRNTEDFFRMPREFEVRIDVHKRLPGDYRRQLKAEEPREERRRER
jgi:hypothetical protein